MDQESKYIYGINPIKERLKTIKKGCLFVKKGSSKPFIDDIVKKAKNRDIEITYIDNASFLKFFGEKKHQLVLKVDEEYIKINSDNDLLDDISKKNKSLIVILDSIKDVGNLGAIIRSCLLFNVDWIILPKNNSAPITETVITRSAGAVFHVNILYVTNIVRIISTLKENGYWVYAACMDGENITNISFSEKSVLILGEENKGIRDLILKNSDMKAAIPTNNKLDSLNLSVSAGIILYEINRQLMF